MNLHVFGLWEETVAPGQKQNMQSPHRQATGKLETDGRVKHKTFCTTSNQFILIHFKRLLVELN